MHGRLVVVGADLVFQFLQKHADVTPARVERLAVDVDRRHALYVQSLDFVLAEAAVYHFVADAGVDERHDVERLHHVGAVGTGQRHVGLQAYLALERLDACGNGLVGQILPLSVGVEHGKEQRGEFMSVGNAAEADAGGLAVAQDAETEAVALFISYVQLVGSRGDVLYER